MKKMLNLDAWKRRAHYQFYKDFERPFFNITAPVEVGGLLRHARENGLPFFLCNLFFALEAANRTEAFRYRMEGGGVAVYDRIHAGSTILYDNGTFGFCYFDCAETLDEFVEKGRAAIERQKRRGGLQARDDRSDLLHCSTLPWVSFTGLQHAESGRPGDSIPKLVFGKYHGQNGKLLMPVSVALHHALADGYDVGRFFETYQGLLMDGV